MARPKSTFTPEVQAKFLEYIDQGFSIAHAAHGAGTTRSAVYYYKTRNKAFNDRLDAALETGTDRLEDEARRRAHDGWDETMFYRGKPSGHIRRYSDTLLIFLLKKRRPEFRDSHNVQFPEGINVTIKHYGDDPAKKKDNDGDKDEHNSAE